MSERFRQWEARPKIKAVGMYLELGDMADGVRTTSGFLLLTKKDAKHGPKAMKDGEPHPWIQVEIVNRDYLLEDVHFDEPKLTKEGHYKVNFTASDLRQITDWRIRGDRLANF